MFGPLPYLHRLLLVLAALGVFIGIGAWLGLMTPVPMGVRVGVLCGVGAGLAAAFTLVHDFHHHPTHAGRVRRRQT